MGGEEDDEDDHQKDGDADQDEDDGHLGVLPPHLLVQTPGCLPEGVTLKRENDGGRRVGLQIGLLLEFLFYILATSMGLSGWAPRVSN